MNTQAYNDFAARSTTSKIYSRHSLRSACFLPQGSQTPARGGYVPPCLRVLAAAWGTPSGLRLSALATSLRSLSVYRPEAPLKPLCGLRVSRHSLRSAWSLPQGSRPPARGGYGKGCGIGGLWIWNVTIKDRITDGRAYPPQSASPSICSCAEL